jgi:subtilase family serine protease
VPEQGGYVFLAEVDPQKYVIEILDDNNTAASDVIGIGWSPDLVVTSIVAPPSAMPGTSFELAVTVCNRGQMNSGYTEVEVTAAGESPTASMFESFLGSAPVGHLEPGQCATSLMPASIGAHGVHRLRAVIDRWNHVSEILENNNGFEGGVIGVGHDADLVVTGVSGPRSWWPYQEFQATARICNQGQGASPGTNVRLYVSNDGLSPPGQPYPAPTWVPDLAPGACTSVTGPVFAQGMPGGYVLGAVVDPEGWVPELIDSNNAGAGQRIAIGHDADLVVTAVVPPPGTLPPSGQAVVIARVCNHGRMMSSDAPVELRLSRDAARSGDDMPVGQGHAPWLEPDACADVPVTASYAAPGQGAYHFLAEVDPQRYVIEILDDNNTGASDVVGIGYDADLVVTSIVAPPSALPGAAIEFAVTVCNRGQMSSSFTEVEVRAAAESPAAPMFEVFLGAAPVAYLPPGQCATSLVPASLDGVYGGYRLRAVVDRWNHVSEILEGNNGLQGGVIGVGYDADLVVTAVTGPASAPVNSELVLGVEACNQGQSASLATMLDVVLSSDAAIDAGDIPVGSAWFDPLAPGACRSVSVPAYPFQPAGQYVLGARVDPQGNSPELIESNNAAAGASIELTPY